MKIIYTKRRRAEGLIEIDGVQYYGPIPPNAGDLRARYDAALADAEIVPYADPPPPPPAPVTSAQAVISLEHVGLLTNVEAVVAQYPRNVQLWYQRAQIWERYNPYVMGIALELGLADAEVDQLFRYASTLDQ